MSEYTSDGLVCDSYCLLAISMNIIYRSLDEKFGSHQGQNFIGAQLFSNES